MTVSRTSLGIGLLFGVLVCVAIGYSLPLLTVTSNPFAEHINQIESHIRSLISQITDLQSQLPFPSPIAVVPR
jgi:hypothetical protein